MTWNKFAKVRGYGNISKDGDDTEVAVEILEIVKSLSFDEFIEEIRKYDSDGIYASDGISNSRGIYASNGISVSRGIYDSRGIYGSDGISVSRGIYASYFIKNCEGLSKSIMCLKTSGKFKLFNKEITEARYETCVDEIKTLSGGWYPKFNNAFELFEKVGREWKKVPANKIVKMEEKEAYKDMPEKLIKYFKSLPEFDAKIFTEITGIEV